jgi:hypothetical protein
VIDCISIKYGTSGCSESDLYPQACVLYIVLLGSNSCRQIQPPPSRRRAALPAAGPPQPRHRRRTLSRRHQQQLSVAANGRGSASTSSPVAAAAQRQLAFVTKAGRGPVLSAVARRAHRATATQVRSLNYWPGSKEPLRHQY